MDKTDVKLTDISVSIMNKKRQVQRIPLYGLLLIYGHLITRDSCSFPEPLHFPYTKFKPLNMDTPLIRTLFMAHSVSVLRLLTGFDCEGKTWLRDTSYVCRKHDFTSLKCLCKIFRGKQCVLSKVG